MKLQNNTDIPYPDTMNLELLNTPLEHGMDIENQVMQIKEMMYEYSERHNRFGDAWALGGTPLRLPTVDEEPMDVSFDQRYTKEWFSARDGGSDNNNHSMIRSRGVPTIVETIKRQSEDILCCIRPQIESDEEERDNNYILMRSNVSYPLLQDDRTLTIQEAEELLILMKIYIHSHQAHDPEWRDHIVKGFWKYLRKQHRFFVLYSNYKNNYRGDYNGSGYPPKDLIGFMRITPYISGSDPNAEYLGAANIERPLKGGGLAGHMFREYFENSGTLAQEVYLHAATNSPVLNKWKKLGFECIKNEIVSYGKKGRTMNVTLMCLRREKYLDIQKRRVGQL